MHTHRTQPLAVTLCQAVCVVVVGVVIAALFSSSAIASNIKRSVIAIDRTGVAAHVPSWSTEVAAIARDEAEKAIEGRVDELTIIAIGANTAESGKVAAVELNIECNNPKTCEADKAALANQIGEVAGQVANVPTKTPGSDIVASLQTARSICGRRRCAITIISDGVDTRLYSTGTAGDQLASEVAPILPSLKRTTVHLVGLGADGTPPDAIERVRTFWQTLLSIKGAKDIQIARSL